MKVIGLQVRGRDVQPFGVARFDETSEDVDASAFLCDLVTGMRDPTVRCALVVRDDPAPGMATVGAVASDAGHLGWVVEMVGTTPHGATGRAIVATGMTERVARALAVLLQAIGP